MTTERRDGHSKLVWDKDEGSFKTVDPHPESLPDEVVNRVARAIATEWFGGKAPPESETEWWLAGLVSAHKLARAAIMASRCI